MIHLRRIHLAVLSGLALIASLSGCASTSYHYSELLGDRYFRSNADTYPVFIREVDGKGYTGRAPVLVEPGLHTLLVQGPATRVDTYETRQFPIDVERCIPYYIVAEKTSRLEAEFTVKVDHQEPVSGCTPPAAK